MSRSSFVDALREAIREEMSSDETVFVMGQDVGAYGGLFGVTKGLLKEFGPERIIDVPILESAMTGAAVGAAMMGMRPIVEFQFADFLAPAMDQIVNNAAKMRYLHAGSVSVPMVIRAPFGAFGGIGAHHAQSPEAWFNNVPGLKIVMPSNPVDAKQLLKAAIRDDNPVLFLEHKAMYGGGSYSQRNAGSFDQVFAKLEHSEESALLGKARVVRKGSDVTVVASGAQVLSAMRVAEKLWDEDKVGVEVVDLRTIVPLDMQTIVESVRSTGRLVVIEETHTFGGHGGEVVAAVTERAFDALITAPIRVGAAWAPIPPAPVLQNEILPDDQRLCEAVRRSLGSKIGQVA